MAMRRVIALLLSALLLSACGFRLQGQAELPAQMSTTVIETSDPYSHFVRRLTILLEQNGARVVDQGTSAARLEIPLNQFRKEILSIGDTARVREYKFSHQVRFRLVAADGTVLVPEQSLQQSRVISFDEQDILAAIKEEEYLREELADTLSRQVLRSLGTAGG